MAARKKTKKKKPKVSKYQRKTRRISRMRNLRHSVRRFIRRGYYALVFGSLIAAIGAGWWWVHSGKLALKVEEIQQAVLAKTADAGLKLQYVYLEGRENAELKAVTDALGLESGDPILGVSVGAIREQVSALGWVKDADVERQFPHTIYIRLIEREPTAIWQYQERLRLVDQSGEVIDEANAKDAAYKRLLLIVGEDAPTHSVELMQVLASQPDLAAQVSAAVRVGKRRWDVHFKNGVQVRLPANNADKAWGMLAEMERQQHLLQRDIRAVDLRAEDRIFIDMPTDGQSLLPVSYSQET